MMTLLSICRLLLGESPKFWLAGYWETLPRSVKPVSVTLKT
jgi:hypothetical protein